MNQTSEYQNALATKADKWVAACGGDETTFMHNNARYLYVYNPAQHKHGYLNLNTDIVEEDIYQTFEKNNE